MNTETPTPTPPPQPSTSSTLSPEPVGATGRLLSLDALRGFDMFWIIGGDVLIQALHKLSGNPIISGIADQMEHKDWRGFAFEDLIFPLFVFIVGISIVFSLGKAVERGGRGEALKRVFGRFVVLYVLGWFYYGGTNNPVDNMRFVGVLQRIAFCYLFGSLLFCFFKPRALVGITAGILLGYWAIMALVPIRDIQMEKSNLQALAEKTGVTNRLALYEQTTTFVRGRYEKGLNVSDHFDFRYLPGRKWDGTHDPEGILSTIPAIATCLLGIFAGFLLRSTAFVPQRKVAILAGAGVASVLLGFLWGIEFPVIKKLWTSSYVLVAAGYSGLLLATFYLVIDVWKVSKWAIPFVWIGVNPITLYLVDNLVDFGPISRRFVGGGFRAWLDSMTPGLGSLMSAIVGILLILALARFLYQRKVFIRV
jgi:predicted acyltransferase